jgi:hypothetical protein
MNCLRGRNLLTESRQVFPVTSGLEMDRQEDPLWREAVLVRKLGLADATELKQKAHCECLWYGPAARAREHWVLSMEAPQQAGVGWLT